MKKLTYHPLMKLLFALLFILSVEGALLFTYETLAAADGYFQSILVYFFRWRFYFPVLLGWTIALAVSALVFLVLLCLGSGRSYHDGEVHLTLFHRIPLDLYLGLSVFLGVWVLLLTKEVIYWRSISNSMSMCVAWLAIFTVPSLSLLFAGVLAGLCARLRAGTWWRNNIITYLFRLTWWLAGRAWFILCRVLRVVWRGLRRVCHKIFRMVSEISAVPLAILFALSAVVFFLIANGTYSGFIFIFASVYTVTGILLGAVFTRRLEKGTQKLAEGDLESRVDTSNLFGAYRRHAEHLNRIREGMSEAVEASLRSERMKTELITNVSHDIKTPLTSIINYVDLMKKEPNENEKINEYLDIMERQSTRLKKLIEDLMEVSKASTGNITPDMTDTDFSVLLEQILGEYRERLSAVELNLCIDNAAQGAHIMADGKLLWRVFDNLLGNICKYSMPGTRVYLGVARHAEMLEVSLRNISLYALNITSEELMERFVRGDRSRHTEGSGLGLSIAKNLVELQKGKLEIVVDGDLFKAIVRFPLL